MKFTIIRKHGVSTLTVENVESDNLAATVAYYAADLTPGHGSLTVERTE